MKILDKLLDFAHVGKRPVGKPKASAEVATNHVWVRVNAKHPDVGISQISDSKHAPWGDSIRVDGVNKQDAERHILGKVIDATLLDEENLKALARGALALTFKELKDLFR